MPDALSHFSLSAHARLRMTRRGVPATAVEAALLYGRVVCCRGAEICAIGRKEIACYAREGIDLSRYQGVQVVCSPDGGVITVYRNRHLPSSSWEPSLHQRHRPGRGLGDALQGKRGKIGRQRSIATKRSL